MKVLLRIVLARSAFFALVLLFAVAGCQDRSRRPVPGVLRFNIMTEPPSLDWTIATDQASQRVIVNIMDGLTRFDEELKAVPDLAESWDVLDEGKRYIFHLRRDARWSDGHPVTADQFVDSWRRLVAPDTAAEYAYFIYMVKNAEAINSGQEKDPAALGVRALDPFTLEVELNRPVVFFPMITTFWATFPLRREVVEKFGDKWTEPENIVTCGPFRLKEWRHEYRIVLERNPDYFGDRPGLDRVIFYMVNELSTSLSLYQTGDLDATEPMPPPSIPSYEKSPEYVNFPYFAVYYYGFNATKPPVDNPKVRAALAHAIDRSQIPNILKGHQIPTATIIPVGMKGANPALGREFNLAKARELLAEAGYPEGKGLPTITIGYNTEEAHKMIAEFIQQQWSKNLGIKVELSNMEWKVYLKELQYDPPQVWRLGWILDYPDPDAIMTVFLGNSGNNHTHWSSTDYDRMVLAASEEPDPKKRQELYDRAQKLLCFDDTVVVPLYSYTINMLLRPWVKDFPHNGLDILDLRQTSIEDGP
jgi:oligopeptide transport system substrate-binding protein